MASKDPLFDDLGPMTDDFDPLAQDLDPLAAELDPLADEFEPVSALLPSESSVPGSAAAGLPAAAYTASDASDHEDDGEDEEDEDGLPSRLRRFSLRNFLRSVGSFGISMTIHVIALVILGMVTFDTTVEAVSHLLVASAPREEIEDPPVEIELQEEIKVVTEQQVAVFSAAPASALPGAGLLPLAAPVST